MLPTMKECTFSSPKKRHRLFTLTRKHFRPLLDALLTTSAGLFNKFQLRSKEGETEGIIGNERKAREEDTLVCLR